MQARSSAFSLLGAAVTGSFWYRCHPTAPIVATASARDMDLVMKDLVERDDIHQIRQRAIRPQSMHFVPLCAPVESHDREALVVQAKKRVSGIRLLRAG